MHVCMYACMYVYIYISVHMFKYNMIIFYVLRVAGGANISIKPPKIVGLAENRHFRIQITM